MEKRVDEIVKKALELFGQYGIKSVSMNDIANSLAMSKKTLYCLVEDKNTLVSEVMSYMKEGFKESLQVFYNVKYNAIEQFFVMGRDLDRVYGNIQPVFLYDLKKYNPIVNKNAIEERNQLLESAFYANIKQGKAEGLYYDDIDELLVSKMLLMYHLHFLGPTSDMFTYTEQIEREIHKKIFKYHFRAICTEKGVEELKKQFAATDKCKF